MERPSYLSKYALDWDLIEVVIGGRSALDTKFFMGSPILTKEQVNVFLKGYGLDPSDPVSRAELFGNFQESLQFIRRYFLKEGNSEGIDLKIPNSLYMVTDVSDLFLMTSSKDYSLEEKLWAEVILKVMHTILHVDKDLRSNYFPVIQTQIFDRFYRYIYRDDENELYLGLRGREDLDHIPLLDFMTKSKKSRDSVIIKLLHKAENVAEELFDRVGVRFITKTRFDTLRVIKFLLENNIVIPHNIKPSRSMNTLFNINDYREAHKSTIRQAIKQGWTEEEFLANSESKVLEAPIETNDLKTRNEHTSKKYQSIQFTCRQLIKYKNPFLQDFNELRKQAKKSPEESELAKKLLNMDVSLIARDVRFFYPYEVQIIDEQAHRNNTEGEASHQDYKKAQVVSAMKRVFSSLLELKNIKLP
jgi:uncharacterized protein (TIGR04562 family)